MSIFGVNDSLNPSWYCIKITQPYSDPDLNVFFLKFAWWWMILCRWKYYWTPGFGEGSYEIGPVVPSLDTSVRQSVMHFSQDLLSLFSWFFAWRYMTKIRKKCNSNVKWIEINFYWQWCLDKWGKFGLKMTFLYYS